MKVDCRCQKCQKWQQVEISAPVTRSPSCLHCESALFAHMTDHFLKNLKLNQCPACASPHLYRQKDFNRKLGLALIVLGVATSIITYGLSLVAVTLVDLWLYRKVSSTYE